MKQKFKKTVISLLTFSLVVIGVTYVHSTVVKSRNLAELSNLAEQIFVGKVINLTDDIGEYNIPYTTITFQISRSLKGGLAEGSTFSYRQFGLLKARAVGDDDKMLVVAVLDGMPQYRVGEETVVFLYKAASLTGLRTAVGLAQGKFTIENGKISNIINNDRLFDRMTIEESKLTGNEARMLSKKIGPVDADTFINLVSRAVNERLFIK